MTHQDAVGTLATERYLLEEMSELERHSFEEHFFACADCAEDLRIGELMRVGSRELREKQPIPFQPRRAQRWVVTAMPWAMAASLALVVGYQATRPSDFNRPYALEPVTLRPASRGGDAVITLAAGDRVAALAVEADAPAGAPHWLYQLRSSDGKQVASGQAPIPTPGTPLMLVVPASVLTPPELRPVARGQRGRACCGVSVRRRSGKYLEGRPVIRLAVVPPSRSARVWPRAARAAPAAGGNPRVHRDPSTRPSIDRPRPKSGNDPVRSGAQECPRETDQSFARIRALSGAPAGRDGDELGVERLLGDVARVELERVSGPLSMIAESSGLSVFATA